MKKYYNYKGFKVEEIEWPHEPEVYGGKVYRFCDSWETIFQRMGVDDAEHLSLDETGSACIFSPEFKGVEPEGQLPELDLSYWPRTPMLNRKEDYVWYSASKEVECRFLMPFLISRKDAGRYALSVVGIFTDHTFCQDGKYGIMDSDGNVKIPAMYDEIKCICWYDNDWTQDTEFIVKKDGKWGKVHHDNNKPCECLYDRIEHIGNFAPDYYYGNMFLVELDGKRGICLDDKLVVPLGEVPTDATIKECEDLAAEAFKKR